MNGFEIAKFIREPKIPKSKNDLFGILHRSKNVPVLVTASSVYKGDELDEKRYPHAVVEYGKIVYWASDG